MTLNRSNDIVAQYTGLILSWLNGMIRRELRSSIDIEQLASKILTELINHLREKFGDTLCDDEIVRICRTITNHRVVDEVRFAERGKRMIPTQNHASLDLEVFHIRDDSLRPDLQVEQDDFIEVLKTLLDITHRELVELKELGWTNQEIAVELHVSIRTVQSRFKTIVTAVNTLLQKSDQLSTINHQPSTISHQPSAISHQPETRNPKPETRNPKPETRNRSSIVFTKIISIDFYDFASRNEPVVALDL